MCEEVKLIAFDMDGVLTKCRSSWRALHLHFKSLGPAEEAGNASKFRNGEIDYEEWMRLDTEAIIRAAGRPIKREEIESVLLSLDIDEQAPEVIKFIKELGAEIALISGGIDILAKYVASALGINHVFANKLIFNEEGELVPGGVEVVNPLHKSRVLRKLSKELDIPLSKAMYVGDSEWDLDAFLAVKYPVYLQRDPNSFIRIPNLYVISELKDLSNVLKKICGLK